MSAAAASSGLSRAFYVWLNDLEKIMAAWDVKWGNLPYDLPLDHSPESCWRDSFDDGMTP